MASKKKPLRTLRKAVLSPRALRWGVLALSLVALAWLAAWLAQRSLRTPARKRALQAWIDDTLNADVSLLGDMTVRINLLRHSRLFLHSVEIEHPNPVFSGKFARVGRIAAWAPPWAVSGILPGTLDLEVGDIRIEIEQAPSGEWSHDGLMQPLAASGSSFPFPVPRFNDWKLELNRAQLDLRRRGYELEVAADALVTGRADRDSLSVRAESVPFSFGLADAETRKSGAAGPLDLGLRLGAERGSLPALIPGACRAVVRDLPVATLPFFATGIPMEDAPGVFNGLIRYDKHDHAAGSLFIEGELSDAPLTVFGLPRTAPLRLNWPFKPRSWPNPGQKLQADIHMGPSGFGAFAMTIPLDPDGKPEALSMRGDVAALDALPGFFLNFPQWPDWLSRTFPRIEWRTGKWLGFGWEGGNFALSLARTTAGMNLSGEAELMGGTVRLAVSPGQGGPSPVTVEAERLDAARLAERLSRELPARFQAKMRGDPVNFTWRGMPDAGGGMPQWRGGMVWTGPVVEIGASGTWWQGLARIADVVVMALPEWGGGNGEELLALAKTPELEFDLISVVLEREAEGMLEVEFRAFGKLLGEATGRIERRPDGVVEGDLVLAGESLLLAAAERANPDLGGALRVLANESPGLRVAFRYEPERGGEFIFPFLSDALALRGAPERQRGNAE